MPIEFVVRPNRNTYPELLVLPQVFSDNAFNGNRHLYLTGIERQRKKVMIVAPLGGPIKIKGNKWVEFINENMYRDVHMLQFVQEGDNSFYVTGYDSNGIEVGGYVGVMGRHLRFQSYRLPYPHVPQDFPVNFFVGIGLEATIAIIVQGNDFYVDVNLVHPRGDVNNVVYVMDEAMWVAAVQEFDIDFVDVVVFTKVANDRLNLMSYNGDGSAKIDVLFLGVTQLVLHQQMLDPEDEADKRMQHICQWAGHQEHFGERTYVFYKRSSQILAFSRLAIPAEFLDEHPLHIFKKGLFKHDAIEYIMEIRMDFHRENPKRVNHVNAIGEWGNLFQVCGFEYGKMIRFKLMFILTDLNGAVREDYPVFHVC